MIKRYLHTVRYLKITQIFYRIYYRFYQPIIKIAPAPVLRSQSKAWHNSVKKNDSYIGELSFVFLNEQHSIDVKKNWNNSNLSKLWLYNLHYFDYLNSLSLVKKSTVYKQLMKDWIQCNPIGFGNGWEPYPMSLRIVNWIKWSLNGHELDVQIINSLSIQIRYLYNKLEFHILGNHLIANIKALIFYGLFFQNDEADFYFQKGESLLAKEIDEQILEDGGHFERSPMYHSIIFEDLLDIINLYNAYDQVISNKVLLAVEKMQIWLLSMCHPDGQISLFNDAAFNIVAKPHDLIVYANQLSYGVNDKLKDVICNNESGYVRIRNDACLLIADIGAVGPDYLPAHGHADTLSFEMSLFAKRFIVDSGTSTYQTGKQRNYERSTFAHNTVGIDETNSSDVWGGFRVGRRAKVSNQQFNKKQDCVIVSAEHNGYTHLKGKPVHHREWKLYHQRLEILDNFYGSGTHKLEFFLHFHPDYSLDVCENSVNAIYKNRNICAIIQTDRKWITSTVKTTYHVEFGKSEDKNTLVCTYSGMLPVSLNTFISWNKLN